MSKQSDIIANIRTTLAAMRDGANLQWVGEIGVYDDVDSYVDTQPERFSGAVCGLIIPAGPTRGKGLSGDEDYAERLDGSVIFSKTIIRPIGGDERAALDAVEDLAGKIRAALLADPSRGGNAGLIDFGGGWVNGTRVEGETNIITGIPNQAIYTAAVPFSVGWWIPRS